ncbi:MAG TPA: T9SS type A sorting domain-containing protein [Cyclobacteriaceae bacterium]|nr:T9SS type A sorting domain-containing protein [Cyclobacteriaceae bacterium]
MKAQTSTIVSGNWTDATIWSNGVPGGTTTTTVNFPTILDQNIPLVMGSKKIAITTGYYTFSENVTDIPDGTANNITLEIGNGGTLDVTAGTTTFLGNGNINNGSSLYVRSGATLILGGGGNTVSIGNNVNIAIEAGGTLIINGDLQNGNNAGTFTVAGLIYVNGNFSNNTGSIDIVGSGDIITTGTLTTIGGGKVFGSTNDCNSGPCSGQNLCGFTNIANANQTLCSGSSASNLTATTDATSPTYLWEYSTTTSTSGFSSAPGTNNTSSYSPGAPTQTTWYRLKVTSGTCTGTSPPVQVTIVSTGAGGWLGTTSSDWNDASNWCSGSVPTSATDVTIPSGVSHSPDISAAASAHNVTINSGATLTISSSATLSVYGNITNNGTFNPASGTVSFVGSTSQTLTSGYLSFNGIEFNNSAGIVFDALAAISNQITLTNGTVNLSGNNITLDGSTLSRTSGWFYNGPLTRSIPGGNFSPSKLFPMGTSSDYRPFTARHTGGANGTAGTIRVVHSGSTSTTDVTITDGSSTIVRRQESLWSVAKSSTLAGTWELTAGGTGFGTVGLLNDLRLIVGTSNPNSGVDAGATGSLTDFIVTRSTLSSSSLTNNFYIGSIDAIRTPLPIQLLNFSGYATDIGIIVEWATATEDNFDHFLLERSIDGIDFESIVRITGKGGHNVTAKYSYLDDSSLAGRVYYRLKIIDLDESFKYSRTIAIERESSKEIVVYPNPLVGGVLYFNLNFSPGENDVVVVINSMGIEVAHGKANGFENELSIGTWLKPGIYFFKYISSHFEKTVKIIAVQ